MSQLNEKEIREKLELVIDKLMHLDSGIDKSKFKEKDMDKNMWFYLRDSGIMTFDWPQGVGLYGLYNMMEFDKNEQYKQFLFDWFDGNIKKGLPVRNINTTAPFLTLCELLPENHNPEYEKLCKDWAEWLIDGLPKTEEGGFQHVTSGSGGGDSVNLNDGQMWVDTLFMAVLFLNKMGQRYGNQTWKDESVKQVLMHIKYLYDDKTGLLFHGWTFHGRNNFGGIHWNRGNSWFTLGILDYIEECGDDLNAGVKMYILDTFRSQVKALKELQGENGLWPTILDDPTSYDESSGTAAIAAGILRGIRTGVLDDSYRECAEKAVNGLLGCILEDGTVDKTSAGTGMGMDAQHYKDIAVMPMAYGQSLTVFALLEALKYIA